MKRRDPILDALNAVADLRSSDPSAPQIAAYLAHRSNLVVAKAAKLAADLRLTDLVPSLAAAFHRLMADPARLDKGCAALTALAEALYSLDYDASDIYLAGARHIQMEASFGPPVDAAAELRGLCALGLVRTRHPDALFEVVRLLADKETPARIGAARALGLAGETGELVLLLKILSGDRDPDRGPEVIAECFSAMLASRTERSVAFVASYLDAADAAVAESAALALGASRLPQAIAALREKWSRTVRSPLRKVLLAALASAREDSALDFLLSLVAETDPRIAAEVIAALGAYRNDHRVRALLEETLRRRANSSLLDKFHAEWGGPPGLPSCS